MSISYKDYIVLPLEIWSKGDREKMIYNNEWWNFLFSFNLSIPSNTYIEMLKNLKIKIDFSLE